MGQSRLVGRDFRSWCLVAKAELYEIVLFGLELCFGGLMAHISSCVIMMGSERVTEGEFSTPGVVRGTTM